MNLSLKSERDSQEIRRYSAEAIAMPSPRQTERDPQPRLFRQAEHAISGMFGYGRATAVSVTTVCKRTTTGTPFECGYHLLFFPSRFGCGRGKYPKRIVQEVNILAAIMGRSFTPSMAIELAEPFF